MTNSRSDTNELIKNWLIKNDAELRWMRNREHARHLCASGIGAQVGRNKFNSIVSKLVDSDVLKLFDGRHNRMEIKSTRLFSKKMWRRMQQWVRDNYPGRESELTTYVRVSLAMRKDGIGCASPHGAKEVFELLKIQRPSAERSDDE